MPRKTIKTGHPDLTDDDTVIEVYDEEKEKRKREEREREERRKRLEQQVKQSVYDRKWKSTGDDVLDNLLGGRLEFGQNILIIGPPFIGKEILSSYALAHGMKNGIPAVYMTTDVFPQDVRDDMKFLRKDKSTQFGHDIEKYENGGLLKFIDGYSTYAANEDEEEEGIEYIASPTDYKGIQEKLDKVTKEFRKNIKDFKTMRFCIRSISTIRSYSDPVWLKTLLSELSGIVKRESAVGFHICDYGMHSKKEIQEIEQYMDGTIRFSTDGRHTYLEIIGIPNSHKGKVIYHYNKDGLRIIPP